MADFDRRGFRTRDSARRELLEGRARTFLHGFNDVPLAANPHAVLAGVPDVERGFAYEGAAMRARLLDLATAGRARAVARLLAGPGERFTHLIHVGCGWVPGLGRGPVPVPSTPLLRWLAVDGAGFAETFFGGVRRLHWRAGRRGDRARTAIRLNGAGRALWFVTAADVAEVGRTIEAMPAPARPELWAGIGLASAYAGTVEDQIEPTYPALIRAACDHVAEFRQGVMFAAAARARSGHIPDFTVRACELVLGVSVAEAATWTDDAAVGLTGARHPGAYRQWQERLRTRPGASSGFVRLPRPETQ